MAGRLWVFFSEASKCTLCSKEQNVAYTVASILGVIRLAFDCSQLLWSSASVCHWSMEWFCSESSILLLSCCALAYEENILIG